jgi:Xaa-Pro aminopeptidase
MMPNSVSLRLAALRELLPAHEIDALLVSGPENRRYLSGFTASDPGWGMVLITAEAALLLTDFRYQEWARQEAQECEVCIHKVDLAETLGSTAPAPPGFWRRIFLPAHRSDRRNDAGLEVPGSPWKGWWRACASGRPGPSWPSCGGP